MMKLSVIIPCYNVEQYLDRCLDSVTHQSYDNLEIILIDDGSTDNTGELCDKWSKQDSRIKVIHKNNEGLGLARNSGLKVATGNYIAFVDSDDYIDMTMYEKLMNKALVKEADIVYCGHYKQLNNGSLLQRCDFLEEITFEKESLIELSQGFFKPTKLNPNMLVMSVWHAVYRRQIIKHNFYSEREVGSEDIHFQVCAVLNANRIVFIPDSLYVYCYNGESLSHSFNFAKYDRYKNLNEILNNTYRGIGIIDPADYCVLIIAFAMIRRIALSDISKKEKKTLISKIVKDDFWDKNRIDISSLAGIKKIFYKILKSKSVFLMSTLAHLYCLLSYSIAKKGVE